MSQVVPFPRDPLPTDSRPVGAASRVVVAPAAGAWTVTFMDSGGHSLLGCGIGKFEALAIAFECVERWNSEMELSNGRDQ
jgi:hypothetical protein